MVHRERVSDAVPIPAASPARPEIPEPSWTNRFANPRAAVTRIELAPAPGAALRIGFRAHAPIELPMAGFLVRNEKGETIFGSNTARENYPMPSMKPGDSRTIDFHWTMPQLAAGRYSVSIAISDGTLESFDVCDYIEDAVAIDAPAR